MKNTRNEFEIAVKESGLNQSSMLRLANRFNGLYPGNSEMERGYSDVLRNMDPVCLSELAHCVEVAEDVDRLGEVILASGNSRTFGLDSGAREKIEASKLAALFHDIALGYNRAELQKLTGNPDLHRWDKNNGVPEDRDSYRGGVLLERRFGDKLGLPDRVVKSAITILTSHGNLEHPWQTFLEFGDSIPYANGDNYARAVISSYLLGDHIDSFRRGLVDEKILEREIDFWKDIGIIEYGSKVGTQVKWDHEQVDKRMRKKGFTHLDFLRDKMSGFYAGVVKRVESKNLQGYIAPDKWAIRYYDAALNVLGDNSGLPKRLVTKLELAHAEALKVRNFYGGN